MKNTIIKKTLLLIILTFNLSLYAQTDEWQSLNVFTGYNPPCQNVIPRYNYSLDNILRISLKGNADIVIKLINYYTDACIRYVYISSGDTYEISNIPEGTYYVKIGFGSDFAIKKDGKYCEAKFLENMSFEKGDDLMDFNVVNNSTGYSVPSFELQLNVKTRNKKDKFDYHKISEDEFYN